jgi:TM2 domain-containing membrane protein YozV
MKYSMVLFVLFCLMLGQAQAGEEQRANLRLALSTSQVLPDDNQPSQSTGDFSSKRMRTALIMSVIVPGAGQTYLGHPTKGALLSFFALGSVVGAYVFQNDITSNNQRMVDVEGKYLAAGNYLDADTQYKLLMTLRDQSVRYRTKRNIFFGIAAAVWALNIADIIFYTPDKGKEEMTMSSIRGRLGVVPLANGAGFQLSLAR